MTRPRPAAPPPFARQRLLKWAALAVVLPSVALFVVLAGFVAWTEYVHDDARCPFGRVEERRLGAGVSVVEESRRCQSGVEEHRWVVVRVDGRHEVGRRRLPQKGYRPGSYRWEAKQEEAQVVVRVAYDGIDDASFREPADGAYPRRE